MKEQRDRADREHQEELDHYLRTTKDLKVKIEELQRQVDEKQVMLVIYGHPMVTINMAVNHRLAVQGRCCCIIIKIKLDQLCVHFSKVLH